MKIMNLIAYERQGEKSNSQEKVASWRTKPDSNIGLNFE
ncbi:hypothetical protein JCM19236_2724 [Vibrio sp. JCM 19236]|nr:hypothetical protein JCM19236_2724 [Vibrio sp. JCM 19236]